jgi:prevent-host-death family protein
MKRASISEAKNGLSALLDRVRQGQSIVIEDRGVPIARLESLGGAAPEGRLARLERDGLIRRAPDRLPAAFFTERLPRIRYGRSASDVVIDERRDGR